jgi:hypothetical protein
VKRVTILASLTLALLAVVGCTDWERTAFQTLAASKATIDQAQVDYEAGTIPKTAVSYKAINSAKDAQTLAVNAMVTYENLKAAGISGDKLTMAQNQVVVDLASIPSLIIDIKALYQGVK